MEDIMFDQLVNANELIAAGIGFSICDEDLPLDSFKIVITEDKETWDPPYDSLSSYWTTSGNYGTIHDMAYQADQVRSAGGWSDVSAEDDEDFNVRNGLEPVLDYGSLIEWSDYRRYLRLSKIEREDRCIAVFDWLRSQTDINTLKSHWPRFRLRVRESIRKCIKSNDWSTLFLTKAQVTTLERYYSVRLRILTK
jgi:hypothetical protein